MNRDNFGHLEGKLVRAPYWLRTNEGAIFKVKFTLCVSRGYRSKKDNKVQYDYPEVHFTGTEAQFAYLEEVLQPGVFVKCLYSLRTENYPLEDGSTKYVTYAKCEGLPSVRNIEFIPYNHSASEEEPEGDENAVSQSDPVNSQVNSQNIPAGNPVFNPQNTPAGNPVFNPQNTPAGNPVNPQMPGMNSGAMSADALAKGFQNYLAMMGIEMPSGVNPNMMGIEMPSGMDPNMMGIEMPSGMDPNMMPNMMSGVRSNKMPLTTLGRVTTNGQNMFKKPETSMRVNTASRKSTEITGLPQGTGQEAWEYADPFVPLQDTEDLPFK